MLGVEWHGRANFTYQVGDMTYEDRVYLTGAVETAILHDGQETTVRVDSHRTPTTLSQDVKTYQTRYPARWR